jgi:hypothetical protein
LADQPPAKPSDLIYEDTGAMAPLVYFDIVGAYGTMNGSIELELATRILVPSLMAPPTSNSFPPAACAAARTPPSTCATASTRP